MRALRQQTPVLERAQHDALVRQNELPGQGADDKGDEEGQQQQKQIARLVPPAMKRDPVRHRVGNGESDHGGYRAVLKRADELAVIAMNRANELDVVPGVGVAADRIARGRREHEHGP